jgi:hypothetical protein
MNRQTINFRLQRFAWPLLVITTLAANARGDGSISFNGTTSKLVNADADILAGQGNITMCMWVNSAWLGAATEDRLLYFDENGSTLQLRHADVANRILWVAGFTGGNGQWTFPVTDGVWNAVAITHAKSNPAATPQFRVNFVTVSPTSSTPPQPGATPFADEAGYSVDDGWNGKIAHVQVFNRILTQEEQDACLRVPGSVSNGLRLWLPMTNAVDTNDRSVNRFHGTGTDLATASDGPLPSNPIQVPRGTTIVPPVDVKIVNNVPVWTYTTVTQHVIPRYASGVAQPTSWSPIRSIAPAGQLIGVGPASVIRGNAQTQNQAVKAVVITEDFGRPDLAMFGSGEYNQPTFKPAVLRPVVRDLTVLGYEDPSAEPNYTSGGKVNDRPGQFNPKEQWPDLYGGVFMHGTGIRCENVTAFYIPGTAFHFVRTGASNAGAYAPWDVEKNTVWDCAAIRAYAGFDLQVIDMHVGKLQGYALRDYGVKFTAGSAQIDGAIHFWGVSPGPAVWFPSTGGGCQGGPIYAENSPTGILIDSQNNDLSHIYSKECTGKNIHLAELSSNTRLSHLWLDVMSGAIGVIDEGNFNRLLNGKVRLFGSSSIGVQILPVGEPGFEHHRGTVIRDLFFEGVASGQGVGIDADMEGSGQNVTISDCIIVGHFKNLAVGIDLYDDTNSRLRLGERNYIYATTDGGVTNLVDVGPNWGTTPQTTTNQVWVNGVRYYKQP